MPDEKENECDIGIDADGETDHHNAVYSRLPGPMSAARVDAVRVRLLFRMMHRTALNVG